MFKYKYLDGKVNKRVDNCLVNLIKYLKDKAFDRVIKLTKGKRSKRQQSITTRHNKNILLRETQKPVRESENTWTMKSTNNSKCYTVSRNSEICNLNETGKTAS